MRHVRKQMLTMGCGASSKMDPPASNTRGAKKKKKKPKRPPQTPTTSRPQNYKRGSIFRIGSRRLREDGTTSPGEVVRASNYNQVNQVAMNNILDASSADSDRSAVLGNDKSGRPLGVVGLRNVSKTRRRRNEEAYLSLRLLLLFHSHHSYSLFVVGQHLFSQ